MKKRIYINRDNVIFQNAQTVYWVDGKIVWKGKTGGAREFRYNQKVSIIKSSVEKVETHYAIPDNSGEKLVKILKPYGVKIQWHKPKVKE